MFHCRQCIVFSDSLPEANADYAYPLKKEKAMLEFLIAGSSAEAGKILDEILDEAGAASFTFFNLTVNRLIFSILSALAETGREPGLHINVNILANEINGMETVDEIRNAFLELFQATEDRDNDRKRQKYDRIIENIVETINQKYSDPNLSLQFIADSISFTPAYTSRIFRQSTGKSIVDYINETRIQKASELLVSTNLNVNAIVERTGFTNAQYFHKVFKKTFGITPNDMRRQKRA
jgi:two-component system, response regulator YesN